jgi:hypothetical protein
MERVRLVADACVGAFFAGDKPKTREQERQKRLAVVEAWLGGDEQGLSEIEEWSREIRKKHAPFHWHLELPEVFFVDRPDPLDDEKVNREAFVDAFVGNPPFLGVSGQSLSDGSEYVDWLQETVVGDRGNRGRCDLSAYFFRRAFDLLGTNGAVGFIATNTIAQGDTRRIGLKHLLRDPSTVIFDATRSTPWPGDAAVTISIVHLARGRVARETETRTLDNSLVLAINSRLRGTPERTDPVELRANKNCAFQGVIVLGMGFTLVQEERDALVRSDPRNAELIYPYLGGQEVNTDPRHRHDRFVIAFGRRSLEEAAQWRDLLEIVRDRVKPERDALHERNAWNRDVRRRWWQFASDRREAFEALSRMDKCLVSLFTTKHLTFTIVSTQQIFANTLWVYPLRESAFAVLQSRIHEFWARLLSSSLEDRLRYAASDCFETFPFPHSDPRAVIPSLDGIGMRLYRERAQYMVDTNQGLTQTYNQLKDPKCEEPRILALRTLHEHMDRAVLDAYSWTDLAVPPFCPQDPDEQRALDLFQDATIDRLFVLNAERADEEERLGASKSNKGKRALATKNDTSQSRTASGKTADTQYEFGFDSPREGKS